MFSQSYKQNRFDNNRYAEENYTSRKKSISQSQKKGFYNNKNHYKRFFYHDITQKKGKIPKRINAKLNKNNNSNDNLSKNNDSCGRNLYYANLLQKTHSFSVEEQVIFERLWKCALGQTFGNRLPAKLEKKDCCCHCQCGNLGELPNRNENNKIGLLKSLINNGVSKKTMKSVVR